MQEYELALGGRDGGLDLRNGCGCFVLGARCEVHFGVVRIEDLGEFLAYAGGSTRDNENLDVDMLDGICSGQSRGPESRGRMRPTLPA